MIVSTVFSRLRLLALPISVTLFWETGWMTNSHRAIATPRNSGPTPCLEHCVCAESARFPVRAVLNWARTRVYEQLCLLVIFKLRVLFLIDVFDLGDRLCSRPMSAHSDARDVSSTGYGSKLLIGWTLLWRSRRNKTEGRSTRLRFEQPIEPIIVHFVHRLVRCIWYSSY